MITIHTDGACLGNPGPGGYGIIMECGNYKKEKSKGYKNTTNNRMELLACIVALESINIDNADVVIYSDSKYVVESVDKGWVLNWEKKDFKGKKNRDLWERFLKVYRKHNVKFKWVKGHSGHPKNERCDFLATRASQGYKLETDYEYEHVISRNKK